MPVGDQSGSSFRGLSSLNQAQPPLLTSRARRTSTSSKCTVQAQNGHINDVTPLATAILSPVPHDTDPGLPPSPTAFISEHRLGDLSSLPNYINDTVHNPRHNEISSPDSPGFRSRTNSLRAPPPRPQKVQVEPPDDDLFPPSSPVLEDRFEDKPSFQTRIGSYDEYQEPRAKTLFGLRRSQSRTRPWYPHNRHDYEDKYTEDPYGEEMGPTARVWKTSVDETDRYDREMVDGWRDSIDGLLVFAGLFSAVLSSFLSQTFQSLQPDYARVAAALLIEQVAIQRAIAAGISLSSIPTNNYDLDAAVFSSPIDHWVNGLWFASLSFSLVTALFAVVMKQWISSYLVFVSGNPVEQTRIRQFRFMGLKKWGVSALFGLLPILLHLSLYLFFAGLVVFLTSLDFPTAIFTGMLSGTAFTLYSVTNLLPIAYPQCPYKTPLSTSANIIWGFVVESICAALPRLRLLPTVFGYYPKSISSPIPPYPSLREKEAQAVHDHMDELDMGAVVWLYDNTSNTTIKDIALESLAGLGADNRARDMFPWISDALENTLGRCFVFDSPNSPPSFQQGMENKAERLARSIIQLDHKNLSWNTRMYFDTMLLKGATSHSLQLAALGQAFVKVLSRAESPEVDDLSQDIIIMNQMHFPDSAFERFNIVHMAITKQIDLRLPEAILLRLLRNSILDSHGPAYRSTSRSSLGLHLVKSALDGSWPIWTEEPLSFKIGTRGAVTNVIPHLVVEYIHGRLFYQEWTTAQQTSYGSLGLEQVVSQYNATEQVRTSRKLILEIGTLLIRDSLHLSYTDRNVVIETLVPLFTGEAISHRPTNAQNSLWLAGDISDLKQVWSAIGELLDMARVKTKFIPSDTRKDCMKIMRSLKALTTTLQTLSFVEEPPSSSGTVLIAFPSILPPLNRLKAPLSWWQKLRVLVRSSRASQTSSGENDGEVSAV